MNCQFVLCLLISFTIHSFSSHYMVLITGLWSRALKVNHRGIWTEFNLLISCFHPLSILCYMVNVCAKTYSPCLLLLWSHLIDWNNSKSMHVMYLKLLFFSMWLFARWNSCSHARYCYSKWNFSNLDSRERERWHTVYSAVDLSIHGFSSWPSVAWPAALLSPPCALRFTVRRAARTNTACPQWTNLQHTTFRPDQAGRPCSCRLRPQQSLGPRPHHLRPLLQLPYWQVAPLFCTLLSDPW
jgi:hypothetical protein